MNQNSNTNSNLVSGDASPVSLAAAQPRLRHGFPGAAEYQEIEGRHPWVKTTPVGPDPLSEFQSAYSILAQCEHSKEVIPRVTTEMLKSHVEAVLDVEIGEGAYLRAALLAGFNVQPTEDRQSFRMNIVVDENYWDRLSIIESDRLVALDFESAIEIPCCPWDEGSAAYRNRVLYDRGQNG